MVGQFAGWLVGRLAALVGCSGWLLWLATLVGYSGWLLWFYYVNRF
jgi:hypothetical protein